MTSGISQSLFFKILDLCAKPDFSKVYSTRTRLETKFDAVLKSILNITPDNHELDLDNGKKASFSTCKYALNPTLLLYSDLCS